MQFYSNSTPHSYGSRHYREIGSTSILVLCLTYLISLLIYSFNWQTHVLSYLSNAVGTSDNLYYDVHFNCYIHDDKNDTGLIIFNINNWINCEYINFFMPHIFDFFVNMLISTHVLMYSCNWGMPVSFLHVNLYYYVHINCYYFVLIRMQLGKMPRAGCFTKKARVNTACHQP